VVFKLAERLWWKFKSSSRDSLVVSYIWYCLIDGWLIVVHEFDIDCIYFLVVILSCVSKYSTMYSWYLLRIGMRSLIHWSLYLSSFYLAVVLIRLLDRIVSRFFFSYSSSVWVYCSFLRSLGSTKSQVLSIYGGN
jgi:hypothetical protein